jgi:hypothetical protein
MQRSTDCLLNTAYSTACYVSLKRIASAVLITASSLNFPATGGGGRREPRDHRIRDDSRVLRRGAARHAGEGPHTVHI